MAEMRDLLRLDLQGADLDTLCEAARRLGFEASYGRAKQASEELLPVPFIAHIEDGGIGHFVVVHQIRWGHAIIADPASGLMRLTIPEFQKRWSRCVILLRPVKPFPKRKSVKTSPMRHLLRTAAMDGRLLGGLTLTSVLGTALSLVAPLAFMYLMKPGGRTDRTLLGFALLAALFSRLTATLIRELITHRYNQTFDFSVGTMYLTNVIALPLREIECRSAGDFYSRLLEICRIRTAITTSILNFAISCLTYLVCLCILVRTNLLLATICLAGTPLAWWILNRSSQRIAELQHDLQCRISASASASVEALSCMRAIKGMCGESSILERLTIRYSAAQGAAHSRDFRAGLINILIAGSSGITMIVLLLAGFALIDRGTINLSLLFICTTLTGLIWSTLEGGVPAVVSIREALESLGRIEDIVAVSRKAATVNPEPKPSVSSVKSVQELRLEQISYAYRNEPVLAGVSTRFKQGELIAVLGESGSGKSTLACVLAGLFSPDSGAILADGFIATPEFLRAPE